MAGLLKSLPFRIFSAIVSPTPLRQDFVFMTTHRRHTIFVVYRFVQMLLHTQKFVKLPPVFLPVGRLSDATGTWSMLLHTHVFLISYLAIFFSDSITSRTLLTAVFADANAMTIESCLTYCTRNGYQFAGIEFGYVSPHTHNTPETANYHRFVQPFGLSFRNVVSSLL